MPPSGFGIKLARILHSQVLWCTIKERGLPATRYAVSLDPFMGWCKRIASLEHVVIWCCIVKKRTSSLS